MKKLAILFAIITFLFGCNPHEVNQSALQDDSGSVNEQMSPIESAEIDIEQQAEPIENNVNTQGLTTNETSEALAEDAIEIDALFGSYEITKFLDWMMAKAFT